MSTLSYARHRFPPAVIQHAVRLYFRFALSYRDVEDLLAERGIDASTRRRFGGRGDEHKPTDEQEFYQLLTYRGDVDLEAKLAEWERFYNLARPHGAHGGKTPDEALRVRLENRSMADPSD